MKTATILFLITALVVAYGCGQEDVHPTVTYEAREFSTPVAEGREGDTIAKDGYFDYDSSSVLFFLSYEPEFNEFRGLAGLPGRFKRGETLKVEIWLSNGIKIEADPVRIVEETESGVVLVGIEVPDVPFVSWQARVTYTPGDDYW